MLYIEVVYNFLNGYFIQIDPCVKIKPLNHVDVNRQLQLLQIMRIMTTTMIMTTITTNIKDHNLDNEHNYDHDLNHDYGKDQGSWPWPQIWSWRQPRLQQELIIMAMTKLIKILTTALSIIITTTIIMINDHNHDLDYDRNYDQYSMSMTTIITNQEL